MTTAIWTDLTKDYGAGRGLCDLDLQVGGEIFGYLDRSSVVALTERLDLDLGRRFREYSRGNKQKLALVLAFMHEPRLLILDEPTSGLDPLNQLEFYQMLQ